MFGWLLVLPLAAGVATVVCSTVCLLIDIGLLLTGGGNPRGIHGRCRAAAHLTRIARPGAYSVDAHVFGRRVMKFTEEPRRGDRRPTDT